jgi:light-regulated signal transduction histidine kinase (bacteriophytochrome)/CheY-like chemotaxis protein
MADLKAGLAASYSVDLTSCDREPIHHIASIQPIGFLIASSDDWLVSRVSANASEHLGEPAKALLGRPMSDLVGAKAMDLIRRGAGLLGAPDAVERAFGVGLGSGGRKFDLAIYRSGQSIVIEAEPSVGPADLNMGAMVRSMLARVQGDVTLVHEAARQVQALTGFDRVMIYRFHRDGSGEIIAERVRKGLEPYLGLRYPAEDIPQQARALLIRNPVRILADVGGTPSPLLPADGGSTRPLDLSMSTLRAHSTMHVEYLQNMGVASTMTVSLVRGGKLWGLISCHHMTPRHIGFEQRTTAELFGQMLCFLLEQREQAEILAYDDHSRQLREQLIGALDGRPSTEGSAVLAARMMELVPCDGAAIYAGGELTLKGDTPTASEFMGLLGLLNGAAAGQVYATDHLERDHAPARAFVDRAAGMLVIPISIAPGDYLVFFRHEQTHAVNWAGQPGKIVAYGPNGPRLTPRKSFEAWQEIVRGQSASWTPAELSAAELMRVTLLEIAAQAAGSNGAEAETRKRDQMTAEINGRVRRILDLMRGLIAQSQTTAADVETFAGVLGDRVHALSRAHGQLTASGWGPGSLAALLAGEVGTLGVGVARVTASGPAVLLQPQAFSTVALVVHELMTNAARDGVLSGTAGSGAVAWHLADNGDLVLDWRESGGAPVRAPIRPGFGSAIIEHSIPDELGGQAVVDYAPTGLTAHFVIPARHLAAVEQAPLPMPAAAKPGRGAPLSGMVLLVEDNMIIALEAEDMLLDLGADRVWVASSVAEAQSLLDIETPSFALLDINLGREMSWPIASRLRELGVPHVFGTGYGEGIDYPPEHRSARSISKPYSADSLARVLSVVPVPVAAGPA